MLASISKLFVAVILFAAISCVTPKVIPLFDLNSQILDHNSVNLPPVKKVEEQCVPDCESQIFCGGELLHDVHMHKLYSNDPKDFVDLKLKFAEAEILQKYQTLKKQNGQVSEQQLRKFVDDNFYGIHDTNNTGLDIWTPPDFRDDPSVLENIRDKEYKRFARDLNAKWLEMSHKVSEDVKIHPDRYSLIYMPNGFIKAGGRFRELYYWDTYWVIRGLLLCDMYETVRGTIENLIYLVRLYGHVPNGSRKYYLQRSQPPLLIQMAATYHSVTGDDDFIRKNLQYFSQEFEFWLKNRMVDVTKNGRTYRMARYNAIGCTPRPESYPMDYNDSLQVSEGEKLRFFSGIRSGAESGWDFSSRHIPVPEGSHQFELKNINTKNFVFVDLNCMLHANAVVLSEWYRYFGNEASAMKYRIIANNLQEAIDNVLYNEKAGVWQDWDLKAGKNIDRFYPSNLTPLWTGSYDKFKFGLVEKVIAYLVKEQIVEWNLTARYWAIPTSNDNTTQQWDYPNGWAPLQAFVIQGLERTGHPIARYVAFNMAQKWIQTTHAGYLQTGNMYEKYHATKIGVTGSGGEYEAQKGFGWTNGFTLEVFNTWGKYLDSTQ